MRSMCGHSWLELSHLTSFISLFIVRLVHSSHRTLLKMSHELYGIGLAHLHVTLPACASCPLYWHRSHSGPFIHLANSSALLQIKSRRHLFTWTFCVFQLQPGCAPVCSLSILHWRQHHSYPSILFRKIKYEQVLS